MKRLFFILWIICSPLSAQEQNSLDWDIEKIFDDPVLDQSVEESDNDTNDKETETTVIQQIRKRGIYFDASYNFEVGIIPGWNMVPWDSDFKNSELFLNRHIRMRGTFTTDAQISDVFRVLNSITLTIPDTNSSSSILNFSLGDFFFDYNVFNVVFVRGGKYELSWGISPNFHFTNLLSRISEGGTGGPSYVFKMDIPVGKGGFQALAMTRFDLLQSTVDNLPEKEDFGFGGKYNLVFSWADFNLGFFYKDGMPFRSFLSIKTTVWNFELYNEWLLVINVNDPSDVSGAGNIGIGRDFFDRRFSVNGELLYNGEKGSYRYQPESSFRKAEAVPSVEGFNIALNLSYKPWNKGNPRLFFRTLYAPIDNSAQLVPGFRLSPLPHIELYLAVPMNLGDSGYYYENTIMLDNKNEPLRFAVVLLVTLNGSAQLRYNY